MIPRALRYASPITPDPASTSACLGVCPIRLEPIEKSTMTRSSPIEYSVFDPEFISRLAFLKWGWNRATCEFWNRGISDTYRIERENCRAYLKLYPYGWRSRDEIQGEVDLLMFLRQQNIRVSIPIRNNAGTFIEKIDAPEGTRYAILFSEAEGTQPRFNLDNSRRYGVLAATIHDATDTLPDSVRRPHLSLEQLAREPLKQIQPILTHRKRDLTYLARVSEELADAVRSLLPEPALQFGLCHGDLTFGNLRRDDKGRLTLFDFDCSGYGWRAYDVAVFLWSRGSDFNRRANANRVKQWNAFLDGYHTVRSLSSTELQAVNLFVPLRQIWQLGVRSNQLPHVGSRAMYEARFKMHLKFIRDWLKVYNPL